MDTYLRNYNASILALARLHPSCITRITHDPRDEWSKFRQGNQTRMLLSSFRSWCMIRSADLPGRHSNKDKLIGVGSHSSLRSRHFCQYNWTLVLEMCQLGGGLGPGFWWHLLCSECTEEWTSWWLVKVGGREATLVEWPRWLSIKIINKTSACQS